ncbi:phage major capsid protein [Schleiferilactobacillus harbinensis]|uniref:phage major capsid protein n=1 Tax=Schleiferilactobacillus harbinensis TaxID=304207 RepID=UPI00126605CE|nr:phage major capsid protein [Schleiferilactobacillus harbinensis]QFR62501.1 phage major capsid protein [Schleiferilactobacillus harbinensis]
MTQQEIKFYNDIKTDTDTKSKESVDVLVPKSIVDRIFDGMTQAHPLLGVIGLQNNGVRLKFLKSASPELPFGRLHGRNQGPTGCQVRQGRGHAEQADRLCCAANDLLDYGPSYLKTYVITQLREAFAVAAEQAFLLGDGAHKPVGLNRD